MSRPDKQGFAERCSRLVARLPSTSPRPVSGLAGVNRRVHLFFRLSTLELALILSAVIFGATALGLVLGRLVRDRSEHLREPLGVLQGALLGLVGLVLAFGLSLAIGRYEARRTNVVADANAIGTTSDSRMLVSA